MDFGDILAQWENQQKDAAKKQKESGKNQVSHKKVRYLQLQNKSGRQKLANHLQINDINLYKIKRQ